MALVSLSDILSIAEQGKNAIPAFNIDNLEILKTIVYTAEELHRPVILAIGQGAIKIGNLEPLARLAKDYAAHASIPIALHLDHGISYEQTLLCMRYGFSSVMIDGSHLPLKENISLTKKVVEAAHAIDVSVEAELGTIGGAEDGHGAERVNLVDVQEVEEFISQVSVDALAIGIGNAHGLYKATPDLDFDRLKKIKALNPPPLVLHGGSGIPGDMIRTAIRFGIRKINVATEIRLAYMSGLKKSVDDQDIYKMFLTAEAEVRDVVAEKIRLFNCQ